MRRLLTSTAALSIALAPINPWPLTAQTLTEAGVILSNDGTILCEPTDEAPCLIEDYGPDGPLAEEAAPKGKKKKAREAAAQALEANEAEAAAGVEADAAAEAEAQASKKAKRKAAEAAAAEAEAAAAAEAEAAANAAAAAAAAAAAEAQASAAAEAEAQAAAAAAAAAEADARAAEEAAAEAAAAAEEQARAAAEAEAAEQTKATSKKAAKAAAAAEAAAEAEAQADAEVILAPEAVVPEALAPEVLADEPVTGASTDEAASADEPTTRKTRKERAAEAAALEQAQKELVVDSSGDFVDPAAGLKTKAVEVDPDAVPVEAPVVTETEAETLTELLSEPDTMDPAALGAAAALVGATSAGVSNEPTAEPVPLDQAPVSPDAVASVISVLTEGDTRSSSEEFAAAPVQVAPGKKSGLSNLEKVGLVALGALAVGAIIKNVNDNQARQVVSNTGDRVVVLNPNGSYSVYKDDDSVLRTPGSTVRTETFNDGSTRTIVQRTDGTQVVTIRDATGRVLRRAAYDGLGREIVLIDDLAREVPVVVTQLPRPLPDRVSISAKDENALLKARLAAIEAGRSGRTFSLRQVREIPEVRALAATIDAGNVTFDSGSSAIKASEADELADLGSLMKALLAENPAEMFLIEGHTDAVGKAAMNLALSDRRAESVALALAEYFAIPPENMVVQGYGESELLINTQADERRNRRVAVRVITPLLRTAAN